jgi:hypothetical protein
MNDEQAEPQFLDSDTLNKLMKQQKYQEMINRQQQSDKDQIKEQMYQIEEESIVTNSVASS